MQNETSNKYSGLQQLLDTEANLQYYNKHIIILFLNEIKKNENVKIADFGAGIGTLSKIIREIINNSPICVEIDEVNKSYLKDRSFKVLNSLDGIKNEFDYIFSSNVLEHIKYDEKSLKILFQSLKKEGKLFLYLPAFQFLFSSMDKSVGHYRRYEKKEIIEKCKKAGFVIKKVQFDDSIGFFASLVLKLSKNNHDTIINTKSLKFYDKIILPISFCLDYLGLKNIFGKNIVVVCQKT